jgi:hypothetical protein
MKSVKYVNRRKTNLQYAYQRKRKIRYMLSNKRRKENAEELTYEHHAQVGPCTKGDK